MADATDLKSVGGNTIVGSTPTSGTINSDGIRLNRLVRITGDGKLANQTLYTTMWFTALPVCGVESMGLFLEGGKVPAQTHGRSR